MASEQRQSDGPGLFVPGELQGRLVEAEQLARYQFARQFADGRRVLDASCGTGNGALMLLEAGAASVTGVDGDAATIGAALELGSEAHFEQADLLRLPFPDGSFDLVVWLETAQHVEAPALAINELRRVLTADGLVVLSAATGQRLGPLAELQERFQHVGLLRQQVWTTSMIQDDVGFAADGLSAIDPELRKLVGRRPGEEAVTVAVASDLKLPDARGVAVVSEAEEYRRWTELFAEQQSVLAEQARVMAGHAEEDAERAALHRRLRDLERELEQVTVLAKGLHDARRDRDAAEGQLEALRGDRDHQLARAERAERIGQDMRASLSWRLTAPLRALKG